MAEPFPHFVDGFLTLRRGGLVTGYVPLEQAAGSDENTGRNGQGQGSPANTGEGLDYDAVFEGVAARFPVILSRLGDGVATVDANTGGATDGG